MDSEQEISNVAAYLAGLCLVAGTMAMFLSEISPYTQNPAAFRSLSGVAVFISIAGIVAMITGLAIIKFDEVKNGQ